MNYGDDDNKSGRENGNDVADGTRPDDASGSDHDAASGTDHDVASGTDRKDLSPGAAAGEAADKEQPRPGAEASEKKSSRAAAKEEAAAKAVAEAEEDSEKKRPRRSESAEVAREGGVYATAEAREKAFLVGLQRPNQTHQDAEESLAELARLLDSAGGIEAGRRIVHLREFKAATLIASGAVEEIAASADAHDCDLIVFDDDLSPMQQRNLEKVMKRRTLTRTELILDIFALHAKTRESMLQVELAQTKYFMPRLVGRSIATAKMGGIAAGGQGGIATRGPGETQLEMDRRNARVRIKRLEDSLKEIKRQRETQRARRRRSGMPVVGVVGYTNAGKSTLLNRLTNAGVLVENRLFSTLDTTVRVLALPNGMEVGLIDTVGFVNKLPTTLVAAFRATLEEAAYADLILHVVDSTSVRQEIEFAATDKILREIGADAVPRLTVWNKVDLMDDPIAVNALTLQRKPAVAISALTGWGIKALLEETQQMILAQGVTATLLIPYARYDLVARLHRECQVLESRETAEGQLLRVRLTPPLVKPTEEFRVDDEAILAELERDPEPESDSPDQE